MHLLAYWRLDNYVRDLNEGAGFNFNTRQKRLHSSIEIGETIWLFTAIKNPPRYFIAAKLVVRSKTLNPPNYKYGPYRVWGDLSLSQYFKVSPDLEYSEAFEILRSVELVTGNLKDTKRVNLPQACQTIRGITNKGHELLEAYSKQLPLEPRALQIADEWELERILSEDASNIEAVLSSEHTGVSSQRITALLSIARRDRKNVTKLNEMYAGRCQLCGFDSPIVYGTGSAQAHHIVYLSRGGDDDLINMVLLCPNHHTVIHGTDAKFDYGALSFCFPNGRTEPLSMNAHLRANN